MKLTLLGPRSVGKSTVSRLLAKKLQYTHLESDTLMHKAMKRHGGLGKAINAGKIETIMKKAPAVIKSALEKDNVVFDLAGGAVAYTSNAAIHNKILRTITTTSTVIGLLPFKNDTRSINLLFQRERKRKHFLNTNADALREKVKKDYLKLKPILTRIANVIVYAGNTSPNALTNKILRGLEK